MKKTIFKYKVNSNSDSVTMPLGSVALSTAVQFGEIVIWALVDTDERQTKEFPVHVYGTGWDITSHTVGTRFLGTVLMDNGALVFHVFVGGGA